MLFSIAGMMFMGSAIDLLVIFLALEVLSLGVYVLTGLRRASAASRLGLAALGVATIAVFYLGILPARVLDIALDSVRTIF